MRWSEPLFLVFFLTALYFAIRFWNTGLERFLIASALFASLSVLTRYVGFGALVALVGLALWSNSRPAKRRAVRAAMVSAVATVTLAPWAIRNASLSSQVVDRAWGIYGTGAEVLRGFFSTASTWVLPVEVPRVIRGAALLTIAGVWCVWFYRRSRRGESGRSSLVPDWRLITPIIAFACGYFAVVAFSRIFLDPLVPADFRMMSPILVLLVVGLGAAVGAHLKAQTSFGWPGRTSRMVLAAILIVNGSRVAVDVAEAHGNAYQYSAPRWTRSRVLEYVSRSDRTATVYSTHPDLIRFQTGRLASEWKGLDLEMGSAAGKSGAPAPSMLAVFFGLPGPGMSVNEEQRLAGWGVNLMISDDTGALFVFPAKSRATPVQDTIPKAQPADVSHPWLPGCRSVEALRFRLKSYAGEPLRLRATHQAVLGFRRPMTQKIRIESATGLAELNTALRALAD